MIKVSTSIWSGDLARMGDAVNRIKDYTQFFHFDIMDGHYVKNFLFGPDIIRSLRHLTQKPFEVHLMIDNPDLHLETFRKAGADVLIVHPDTCPDLKATIEKIGKIGAKAGLALKTEDPVSTILPGLSKVGLVLVMGTKIGFRNLPFSLSTLTKITTLKRTIQEKKLNLAIEVDGGVTWQSVSKLIKVGVDTIVVGSLAYESRNVKDTFVKLRNLSDTEAK